MAVSITLADVETFVVDYARTYYDSIDLSATIAKAADYVRV